MLKIVREPPEHTHKQTTTRLFFPEQKSIHPGSEGGTSLLEGIRASQANAGQSHSPVNVPFSWLVHSIGLSGLFWLAFRDGIAA